MWNKVAPTIVLVFLVGTAFGAFMMHTTSTVSKIPKNVVYKMPAISTVTEYSADEQLHHFVSNWIHRNHCRLSPSTVNNITDAIIRNSKEWGIPPELIMAIIEVESEYKVRAVSNHNCKGLMQIDTLAHKEEIAAANVGDIFNVYDNIYMGCLILDQKMKETDKGIVDAINRYNACVDGGFYKGVLNVYAKIKLDEEY